MTEPPSVVTGVDAAPDHPSSTGRPDPTTGVLLLRFTDQISTLIKAEVALAKLEMGEKAKRLGLGAGLLGAAGFLALYGLGALLVTAGIALALVVDGWLAGLIVTGGIFLLVAILAGVGIRSVKRGAPPVPTTAIESAKKDLATAKGHRA